MDKQIKSHVVKLLEEAEQAADVRTNGLFDRDEFPILIRQLLIVTRQLLAEREQMESYRNEPAIRSQHAPREYFGSIIPFQRSEQRDMSLQLQVSKLDQWDDEATGAAIVH